eukprot:2312858-Rhodomonas_salina.1
MRDDVSGEHATGPLRMIITRLKALRRTAAGRDDSDHDGNRYHRRGRATQAMGHIPVVLVALVVFILVSLA